MHDRRHPLSPRPLSPRSSRALLIVLVAIAFLTSSGCVQFQLSDGSVGTYDPGLDIFSSPAPLFRREARRRPPAAVARLRGSAIVVDKPTHRLLVYDGGRLRRQYKVALGIHSDGHKVREDDHRTPEGFDRVIAKKDRGQTRFHRPCARRPNAWGGNCAGDSCEWLWK